MRFCLSPLLADGNAALTFYLRLPTHRRRLPRCSIGITAHVREETSQSYRGASELAALQDSQSSQSGSILDRKMSDLE